MPDLPMEHWISPDLDPAIPHPPRGIHTKAEIAGQARNDKVFPGGH